MSRTRRFLGGLTFGYLNMVVVTLVGLWLARFLLEHLGERDYGLWLVVAQILAYLLLMDLGVVALLPREIAYATGRAGSQEAALDLGEIAGRTLGIVLWQLPLVALASAAVFLFFPADWEPLRIPFALVILGFVLTFPLRTLQGVLRGLQDLAFLGASHTVSWALSTAAIVIFVILGLGLYAMALGWVTGQIISAGIWWVRLRRKYPRAFPRRIRGMRWSSVKGQLMKGGWVSVSQVAQVLVAGTDLLIVGRVIGPSTVVLYFCTAKLITVLAHQPQMLMEAAQPGLAEMKTGESKERLRTVCAALTQAMLIGSGAVVCLVLGVNQGFVNWWVGSEYFGGLALTVILLGAMLLRHWNVTAVYALFAFGRERRIALTALGDGIITVASQIILARALGPIGVAIGTLIGVLLISLPINLTGLGQETGSLFGVLSAPAPWLWRFILVAALATVVATVWRPDTLPLLVLAGLGLGAAYAAIMLPLALRGELSIYVRPRLAHLKTLVAGSTGS